MRASKFLLISVVLISCTAVIILLNSKPAVAWVDHGDNDWDVKITPTRVEIPIGATSGELYWIFTVWADSPFMIFYDMLNAPKGITVTPPNNRDYPIIEKVSGNRIIVESFKVSIDSSFSSTDEQRIDMTFAIVWNGNYHWKTVSLYVLPVAEIKWEVTKYSPNYVSLENYESTTIYIGIRNNYSKTLNFYLNAVTLNPGFALSALSGTISINAGEYKEWTVTLTCTGYALVPDKKYLAATWEVTNLEAGTTVGAGNTIVTFIGETTENVADLEIWWTKTTLEIPFADTENVYLVLKNIGDKGLSFHSGFLCLTTPAYWIMDFEQVTLPVTLAPNENLMIKFSFQTKVKPEEVIHYRTVTAQAMDNWGNSREAYLEIKAVVGTFSVNIRPMSITVQQGQVADIYVSITNNENANRNYIIDSMELRIKMDPHWAKSVPLTENTEITAFGSREVKFQITALGTAGERWFTYFVRCEQTGKEARIEVAIEIIKPLIPTAPHGQLQPLLELFSPFTGGDLIAAGYFCAIFMLIIPLAIVGLAISKGKPGLTVSIFGFTGIILSCLLGLIPMWIFIFILFIIAIYLSRGFIWGRGGA